MPLLSDHSNLISYWYVKICEMLEKITKIFFLVWCMVVFPALIISQQFTTFR